MMADPTDLAAVSGEVSNPDVIADDGVQEISVDYAARKRFFIKLLLGYAAILGVVSAFISEDDTRLDVPLSLPILILGVAWCFADAAQREHYMGRVMRLLLVLFFIVVLPIYLFQTRGLAAFKALGLTALMVIAMLAIMIVTALAMAFVGGATGLLELPAPA